MNQNNRGSGKVDPRTSEFEALWTDWGVCIPRERLLLNEQICTFKKTCYSLADNILAVLKIDDVRELKDCVKVANQYLIPIYPISCGKNWGYGSYTPPKPSAVFDLSALNKIQSFDSETGCVTLEPGVTFRQLNQYVKSYGYGIPPPGSSDLASVMGNCLERGSLPSSNLDLKRTVEAFTVLLATGEEYSSDDYDLSVPLGMDLTELFFQSNLGVVTSITLRLCKVPKLSQQGFFWLKGNDAFLNVLSAVEHLKRDSVIAPSAVLYNDYKMMSLQSQYPFALLQDKTPMKQESLEKLKRINQYQDWFCVFGFASENERMHALKGELIVEAFGQYGIEVEFTSVNHPHNYFWGADISPRPTEVFWRKKTPQSDVIHPALSGCGVLWINGVIDHRRHLKNQELIEGIKRVMIDMGFEPSLTIRCVSYDYQYLIIAIIYDRELNGEDEKALECQVLIKQVLQEQKCRPYRLGVHEAVDEINRDSSKNTIQSEYKRKIKSVFDPNSIISPGRYGL